LQERRVESSKHATSGDKGTARRSQKAGHGAIAKKTWADVVKAGGINVQIVLGNGNLGLVPQRKRTGERRDEERGGGGGTWRRVDREAGGRGRRAETGETES
jgi:hypothetical protein